VKGFGRHRHEVDKGKVTSFAVQLEVFAEDEWKVVIRYDSAHGYSHMDRFYRDGRRIKKDLHLNLKEALTLADEDIEGQLESLSGRFYGGEIDDGYIGKKARNISDRI
jgi:hypothetical protein